MDTGALYTPYDPKCEKIRLNGNRCNNNKDVGLKYCTEHSFRKIKIYGECEAVLIRGRRKGEKCGVRTLPNIKYCGNHKPNQNIPSGPS